MEVVSKDVTYEEAKKNYRKNEINCPDLEAAKKMEERVLEIKKEGDTAGGIIELVIHNLPGALGEPVFDKINALLAHALMSIGAIKGIEFGAGFKCGNMKGSEFNDQPYLKNGKVKFQTNNSGGTLGGMTYGDDIIVRLAVKPTPTVSVEQKSVNMKELKEEKLEPVTRRDPTLLARIYVVAEAMAACAVLDALYLAKAYDSLAHLDKKWMSLKSNKK
jgi:chorismate synthase